MTAPSVQVLLYPAGAGPMLTAADSDFEVGTGSWTATSGSIAQSSAQAHTGSSCLALTGVPSPPGASATSGLYALPQSGVAYTVSAWVRAAATPRVSSLFLAWYDANQNFISSTSLATANDSTSAWTQLTGSATAPANAAYGAIEIYFPTNLNEVHYLDTVAFVLPAAVDVSSFLTGSIQTVRGRTLETDQYQAGTLTFTLRNETREFDPSNTAGTYYGQLTPGIPVVLNVGGVQVFGGYVDDVLVEYEIPDICITTFSCFDGFNLLAMTDLASYSALSQTTGVRIYDIITRPEVNYPQYFPCGLGGVNGALSYSLDNGQSTLQAGTFDQTPAIDQCKTAATSEQGWLFVSRSGVLTFFNRYHLTSSSSVLTLSDTGGVGDQAYQGITQKSESILLFNRVSGTRTGGSVQIANQYQSQARYGIRILPLAEIELLNDAVTLNLCQYVSGRYSAQNQPAGPAVRFDTFTIELQALTSAQLTALLELDITSVVTVQRTPPGSGSPTTISVLETIDGVSLTLDVSRSAYTAKFNLASIDERSFLILNDSVLGKIDSTNLLGF